MKTSALLFFFLFAFTKAEFVYDSNGDLLKNGGKYYLLPPSIGGEAITGAAIEKGGNNCSLAVVQKLLQNKGWPTKIATPFRVAYITTDYPLNISFAHLPLGTCTKNPHWLVTRSIGFGNPVMVGDAKEFPTPLSGWFYIKPYNSPKHHYKLVFCFEHGKCGHVGTKTDSLKNKRLIVTEDKKVEPLVFKFGKETSLDDEIASDILMVV